MTTPSVGLVSVTYRQLSPEEIISLAASAGVSCIEWGSDVHVPPHDLANACRVGEMTRAAGMTASSYGTYYRLGQGQDFAPYLAAAQALGTKVLRVWAGVKPISMTTAHEWDAMVSEAQKIACMAAEQEALVCFEYHPGTLTQEAATAARLMQAIQHPYCRLYWQPDFSLAHKDIYESVQDILPHIVNLHVFYWTPQKERRPLSEGHDFWVEVLRRIPNLEAHRLLLEFVPNDDPALLSEEVRALQHIIKDSMTEECS